MAKATFSFPRGFMWGTATSSHQVEGNNTNNNWWDWEQTPGNIINGHKSGLACDWWGGRWREDFDRAAETGQNFHRLSIEWSRIQPTPDRWLSVSERIDVNRYRELMKHAFDDRFVSHELRFAESMPYRQRLIEALYSIIQNPENAETEFQLCGEDWNRLTAQVGRDVQKKRLAKGVGLEAYRD